MNEPTYNAEFKADPGLAGLQRGSGFDPEPLLVWEAAEYVHYEKGRAWYMVAGVLTLLMIGYSLLVGDYIPAIAVALLAGVVYLYSHEVPTQQRIMVTRLGISAGEQFYAFTSIKAFWLIINRDVRQLHLETATRLNQTVVLQLGDTDPVLVRQTLSKEVPEAAGRDEGFLDRLARMLKL